MRRSIVAAVVLGLVSVGVQASLLGRAALTPGGADYQAYYDTALDITWVADANLAATMPLGFDQPGYSCYYAGSLCWPDAVGWNDATHPSSWIGKLNAAGYLGINAWRLPLTLQPDFECSQQSTSNGQSSGYSCTGSEFGHLWYHDLGGVSGGISISVQHNDNFYLFQNIRSGHYLTYCVVANSTYYNAGCGPGGNYGTNVWNFNFLYGYQSQTNPLINEYLWPVADGDPLASTAPIPPAVWLFGSALGVMGWMRRKATA